LCFTFILQMAGSCTLLWFPIADGRLLCFTLISHCRWQAVVFYSTLVSRCIWQAVGFYFDFPLQMAGCCVLLWVPVQMAEWRYFICYLLANGSLAFVFPLADDCWCVLVYFSSFLFVSRLLSWLVRSKANQIKAGSVQYKTYTLSQKVMT
jgi:hypothetical protein